MFNYSILLSDKLSLVTFGLLALSLVSLWIKRHILVWGSLLVAAITVAFFAARINLTGIGITFIYGLSCYLSFKAVSKKLRVISSVICFVWSIYLYFHWFPGFNNWQITKNLSLSHNAIPINQFLNFDKALIGLFLIPFGIPCIVNKKNSGAIVKKTLPLALMTIIIVTSLAVVLNYVAYDLKWNNFYFIWAFSNLFFNCIAEEALFRGFLQQKLTFVFLGRKGPVIALLLASFLFGLTHYPGGLLYIALASIAGLGYGLVYQKTRSIEASIVTHFLLNTVHFIGFTYPALQPIS